MMSVLTGLQGVNATDPELGKRVISVVLLALAQTIISIIVHHYNTNGTPQELPGGTAERLRKTDDHEDRHPQ